MATEPRKHQFPDNVVKTLKMALNKLESTTALTAGRAKADGNDLLVETYKRIDDEIQAARSLL